MIPWKLATRHGETKDLVLVLLTSAAILNTLVMPFSSGGEARHRRRVAWGVSVALAILTLLGNEASAAAIARISSPLLSVLQRFEVLLVGGLAWVALGERPSLGFWIGAAAACAGVVLMQGGGEAPAHLSGVLLALLAASAFSGMAVLTRRFIAEIDPISVNALRLWLSLLCWVAFHRELPALGRLSPELVAYGALAALCGPFLGRLFFMFALRHVEARIAALCNLLAPVVTLGLSFVFLADVPSSAEIAGGAVILAGVAIPIAGSRRRRSGERSLRPRVVSTKRGES
jgi:drug/metabolite transporter (DMT)-like permease